MERSVYPENFKHTCTGCGNRYPPNRAAFIEDPDDPEGWIELCARCAANASGVSLS